MSGQFCTLEMFFKALSNGLVSQIQSQIQFLICFTYGLILLHLFQNWLVYIKNKITHLKWHGHLVLHSIPLLFDSWSNEDTLGWVEVSKTHLNFFQFFFCPIFFLFCESDYLKNKIPRVSFLQNRENSPHCSLFWVPSSETTHNSPLFMKCEMYLFMKCFQLVWHPFFCFFLRHRVHLSKK